MELDELWVTRLAIQRLAGPAASDPTAAVRASLAVQSQDVPLADDSLAQRTGGTAADVERALASARIVRTHVLRPTWHYVAAEDVRWLLALTGPKIIRGLAARHRQLELGGPERRALLLDAVASAVTGTPRTRAALAELLAAPGFLDRGHPDFWAQLSHVCILAELEGLVCSGPRDPQGLNGHTYALLDEVVPPAPERSREEAIVELVGRFYASHGPVAIRDLQRWTRLTQAEIRGATAALGDAVSPVAVAGAELWCGTGALDTFGPGTQAHVAATARARGAWLLSTFDEAVLTHSVLPVPVPVGAFHEGSAPRYGEAAGGPVLWDLHHVGAWKRTARPGAFTVHLQVTAGLPDAARAALVAEADALARRAGASAALVDLQEV